MSIKNIIRKHYNEHGSDAIVLVMAYNDDLLLAARIVIQKIAPVRVELLTFPLFYNELDTEKMLIQINEAKPTLIINAAEHEWIKKAKSQLRYNVDVILCSDFKLRTLVVFGV